jgi:hippurate hydrolase
MQVPYAAHNPKFMVDLAAIPVGTSIATIAMLELLQPEAR